MNLLGLGLEAVERGLVPDVITRAAIRRLCADRLRDCRARPESGDECWDPVFAASLRSGPIAHVPEKANEQHYELPAEFFAAVLGPHRKYSCCYWPNAASTFAEAEQTALELTCSRADLHDGQDVLELGCGWGSLSLWMAEHYPRSRITAVSNSAPQRRFIEAEVSARGLTNLRVITADINHFRVDQSPDGASFDRVVSVEMFEHLRNYDRLLQQIAEWLRPDGKLFVHHFCHREFTYPFEVDGDANWMGRYFFTGGIMPAADLLSHFHDDLRITKEWSWNGRHYQRTADAWLANLDARRRDVLPILESVYGRGEAPRWLERWRMFFLAVSELFGFARGDEWFVRHALLEPVRAVRDVGRNGSFRETADRYANVQPAALRVS